MLVRTSSSMVSGTSGRLWGGGGGGEAGERAKVPDSHPPLCHLSPPWAHRLSRHLSHLLEKTWLGRARKPSL